MNILVIHQYFLRSGEPGGTRFNDFASAWTEAGHDVRVVASSVRYDSGRRTSSIFPWRPHRSGDVRVRRVWTLQHPGGDRRRRLASMLGFGVGGILAAIAHPLWRPDVVLASSPSLSAAVPGLVAASAFDCPFVFEVRDLWPESAVTTGVVSANSPLVRAAEALEEEAYALADRVVALTPGIAADIVERGLVESERVVVIPNGVDLDRLGRTLSDPGRDAVRRAHGWSDRFVAIYAGAHGIANDLDQLLDAAQLLTHREDILFVCVGDGPRKETLMRRARKLGLDNVEWLAAVPPDEAARLVAASDAALVLLQDNPTFRTVYPNKMFDAMAAEIPVVCGVDGVARELVVGSGAGAFVPPGDSEALAITVAGLAADPIQCLEMGWSGRQLVEERFDRRHHAAQYAELFVDPTFEIAEPF